MDLHEEPDEQITRYIHNKMDAQEISRFEDKLASDPLLKKEVEQLQQLISHYDKDLVDLKVSLQGAESRYRQKKPASKKRIRSTLKKKLSPLLAIAGVLVIAAVFYFTQNKENITQLAKENSLDGLNKASVRKGDSIAVADVLFYSGDYTAYIAKALSLLKENPDSMVRSILNINICKSYIQLNQSEKAITFYQSLTKEEKEYCYLQYQAALAYTINNKKNEAVPLFEAVINKGCFPVDKKAGEWVKRLK